ncbi:hypothetical protein NDU88_008287 [Pleurodeles waltl]|uniref:Uncharacterized protein n=1 Tax=Pleurodeles waltl TaxID=8319 RepID=A0AAV7RUB1_PLEWA|nr:hypothetical protein NDU88_008287 [Pleurodeles waltl]
MDSRRGPDGEPGPGKPMDGIGEEAGAGRSAHTHARGEMSRPAQERGAGLRGDQGLAATPGSGHEKAPGGSEQQEPHPEEGNSSDELEPIAWDCFTILLLQKESSGLACELLIVQEHSVQGDI